jgi:glutaredoxin
MAGEEMILDMSKPYCPHCAKSLPIPKELVNDDDCHQVRCPHCNNKCEIIKNIEVTYDTVKVDEDDFDSD